MLNAAGRTNVVSVLSRGIALSFGGVIGVGIIEIIVSGRLIPGVTAGVSRPFAAALVFLACAVPSILTRRLWPREFENATPPTESCTTA